MSIRDRAVEVFRKRRDECVDAIQEESGAPRHIVEAAVNVVVILAFASIVGVLLFVIFVATCGLTPWLAMFLLPVGMFIAMYLARRRPPSDDE